MVIKLSNTYITSVMNKVIELEIPLNDLDIKESFQILPIIRRENINLDEWDYWIEIEKK